MPHDVRDDNLMRRFVLGDVTAEEQQRVEQAFIDDRDYFEALCALEHELIAQYLNRELPDEWCRQFESSMMASPARRRRVDETARLISALLPPPSDREARRPVPRRAFGLSWPLGFALACVAGAALIVGGWLLRRPPHRPADAVAARGDVALQPAPATFVLEPGQTRSASSQVNVFHRPRLDADVRLEIIVPLSAIVSAQVTLQPVGGSPLPIATIPVVRDGATGTVVVAWLVPARVLSVGDYVLTLTGLSADGTRSTLARRSFSVVD